MANPQDWRTRVIGALGAVLAVALVIGGVVGAVAYGAAKVTGLTGDDPLAQDTQAAAPASVSPSHSASPSPSKAPAEHANAHPASARQTKPATPTPSHSPSPKPKAKHKHPKAHHHRKHAAPSGRLTLSASPHHVGHMGRIDLSGRYRGHDGATLDVQQRVAGGHWSGFPVTARVRGGSFHTWVESGRRGPNQFRVVDPATGAASDAVTVVVG